MSVVNLGNGSPKRKKAKGKAVRKMTKGGSVLDPKGMRNGGDASRSAGATNSFANPRARRGAAIEQRSKRGMGARRAQMMADVSKKESRSPTLPKTPDRLKKMMRSKAAGVKMSKGGSVKKPKG
jgi:hypothetical protein